MKRIVIMTTILLCWLLIHSCNKDRFDQPVLGQLDASKLANRKGVEALLVGAYAFLDGVSSDNFSGGGGDSWLAAASNWVYGSICGSEAYKGSEEGDQKEIYPIETFASLPVNRYFEAKWGAVYGGVQRANTVLRVMAMATDIGSDDFMLIKAEALFLRAHYHFEAKKMWGRVPFVDETITYDNNNYHLPNDADIWPNIENDLLFAVDNLPETQTQAIGRANKYVAKAYLAKVYMFQRKFSEARTILLELIQRGVTSKGESYGLLPHFNDNFNAEFKNSKESVFAVQNSVNDGGASLENGSPGNGGAGDILNFPFEPTAPGGCCGFFQPSQYLVNHFRTDPVSGLPYLDTFNLSDVKNDEGLSANDDFDIDTQTLDPRLDWTVGRRGIPYLDWGLHPGMDQTIGWIRGPHGPYSPIKNVYYKSQQGTLSDDGNYWARGLVANNTNLIRFADILLLAAEAEAESGNLDQARIFVNQVRERAMDKTGWVKNNSGAFAPYAANYHIGLYPADSWTDKSFALKAIRFERMLELGMEGHRFFDLVRWGIADVEINAYLTEEKTKRSHLKDAIFIKGCDEYFPIPQRQLDLSAGADGIPKMKQNPCY